MKRGRRLRVICARSSARFGSCSRNIAVMLRRSQTKRRVKARSSSLRAVVTELYPKSQTAFCHQEKTRSSGSCPAALAATSEEHSRFPSRTRDAAKILRTGRTVRIDAGRVSYVDHNGTDATRYFVGVASCGMSTKVIERVKADHAPLPLHS